MSVDTDIFQAFFDAVTTEAAAADPVLAVAYPGVTFDPPDNAVWLELRLFPNETQQYGLAVDGPKAHRGFVQVSVCKRPGTGVLDLTSLAGVIVDTWLPMGTVLGLARVYRAPWLSAVVEDNQRGVHFVPVTVPYQATVNSQGPEQLGPELIDADVDFATADGWTFELDGVWSGFNGSAAFDENLTGPELTAPFTVPSLSAGRHRLTVEITGINGEYLMIQPEAGPTWSPTGVGVHSTVYEAVGGETFIMLRPQGELNPAVGTITSVSLKRIL